MPSANTASAYAHSAKPAVWTGGWKCVAPLAPQRHGNAVVSQQHGATHLRPQRLVQLRHAIRAGRQRRRRLVDQPCDGEVARERFGPPCRALLHRARTRRAHRRRRALGRVRRRGSDGGGGGAGSVGGRRGGGEQGADVEADARGFGVQAEGEVVEGAVAALGQDGVEDQLRSLD